MNNHRLRYLLSNQPKIVSTTKMSTRSKFGQCRFQAWHPNRIIIGAISLFMVLVSISGEDICETAICKSEAQKYLQQMDPSVDPCEDFYQFACGNFRTLEDEIIDVYEETKQQRKMKLLDMYREDIHADDHKTVKFAKQLFQKCVDEEAIEKDNLQTIKSVIKELGGWPVVEGRKWDESKFDWLRTTYKLRQLGYPHFTFLTLKVEHDKVLNAQYIFQIDLGTVASNAGVQNMVEVAKLFGATESNDELFKEMQDVRNYQQKLVRFDKYAWWNTLRVTVNEYQLQQTSQTSFDLLEFINNIVGSTAQITKDSFVLVPQRNAFDNWLNLVSSANKRTQANFMIFKMIEQQIPYLTKNLQNLFHKENEAREELCFKDIEARFIPSPIQIMSDRKVLPAEKIIQVEEMLETIRSVFVEKMSRISWLEPKDRRGTIERVRNITFMIGQPRNYFENTILDNIDVDFVETGTDTFLSLLAQATRNHQTSIYNQINMSVSENVFAKYYIKDNPGVAHYSPDDNVIFIPTIATEDYLFREGRPRYLNYPKVGQLFASVLPPLKRIKNYETEQFQKWSNQSLELFRKKVECIEEDQKNYQPELVYTLRNVGLEVFDVVIQLIGDKITYAAYQKWTEQNGEEKQLSGIAYTPNQLFRISAAICQPLTKFMLPDDITTYLKHVVYGTVRNNADFAKDFNCSIDAEMNPKKKCNPL